MHEQLPLIVNYKVTRLCYCIKVRSIKIWSTCRNSTPPPPHHLGVLLYCHLDAAGVGVGHPLLEDDPPHGAGAARPLQPAPAPAQLPLQHVLLAPAVHLPLQLPAVRSVVINDTQTPIAILPTVNVNSEIENVIKVILYPLHFAQKLNSISTLSALYCSSGSPDRELSSLIPMHLPLLWALTDSLK